MNLDLNGLNSAKEINFEYSVFKDDDLDNRILDFKDAKVKGKIYLNYDNEVVLDCVFNGYMIIDDSVSLEPVPYKFEVTIEENLNDLEENYENSYDKLKNTLDLKKVLWQNIVLEVPISYTEVIDADLKGNGWELVNENKKVKEIDPRLKKLKELLER